MTASSEESPGPTLDEPGAYDFTLFDLREQGRYQIIEQIGQGGMGRVFAAYDQRLGRDVAVKELFPADADLEARLVREARLTARLDHPNIVPVYDAGRGPSGRLFYTMRLIRGRTLADHLREAEDLEARLHYLPNLLEACRAVAFAHERRVVHRDLKPSNILVGPMRETQVADWGLARSIGEVDRALHESGGVQTWAGSVLGTPRYLAPEVAAGAPADDRSDVWSLGAILFQILAGAAPWRELDVNGALEATRTRGAPPIRELAPLAPRELLAICERATTRDPAERYPSARALAEDLEAWVAGRRVAAHDYTPLEHFTRFVRAWRVPLAVGLVAVLATIAGVTAAWVRATRERDRAEAAEQTARGALVVADGRLAALLLSRAQDLEAEDARPEAELLAAHSHALAPSPEAIGTMMALSASPGVALVEELPLERCEKVVGTLDGGWLCLGSDETVRHDPAGAPRWRLPVVCRHAAVAPEGGRAILHDAEGLLSEVDLESGARERTGPALTYEHALGLSVTTGVALTANRGVVTVYRRGEGYETRPACGDRDLSAVALTADGTEARALCADGELLAVSPARPARRHLMLRDPAGLSARVTVLMAGHGGELLAGTLAGEVGRVRGDRFEHLATRAGFGALRRLVLSPEGRHLVVIAERGGPALLDLESGAWVGALPERDRGDAVFLSGASLRTFGRRVATWRLPEARSPRSLRAEVGLASVAFSPNGALAVTAGADGHLAIWRLDGGLRLPLDAGFRRGVKQAAFTSDGAAVVAGAMDVEGLRLMSVADGATRPLPGYARHRRLGTLAGGSAWALGFDAPAFTWSPEGAMTEHGGLRTWIDGRTLPDGSAALALDAEGGIHRLDEVGIRLLTRVPAATDVAASPGGASLAAGAPGRIAILSATGDPVRVLELERDTPGDLAFSHDGRFLAAVTIGGELLVWRVVDGALVARFFAHAERGASVAWAPDDRRLLTAGWDRRVRIYGAAPLEAMPRPRVIEETYGLDLEAVVSAGPVRAP